MPAYGFACGDEEIEALVAHLKTLAPTTGYPPGDLYFLRPVRTIKPSPENEGLLIGRYESGPGDDPRRATAYYATRFGRCLQAEVKATTTDSGAGGDTQDLELGLKWAFHHDLERSLLLGAGAEIELPLDQPEESEVLIPYLSFAKGVGDNAEDRPRTPCESAETTRAGEALRTAAALNRRSPSRPPRGAATLPAARGQGLQTALMHAALARARAAGCDLAVATILPGSTSQRLLERLGLHVAYTRSIFLRPAPASS